MSHAIHIAVLIENTIENTTENIAEKAIENTAKDATENIAENAIENAADNTAENKVENTIENAKENVTENALNHALTCEHGLSLLIEYAGKRILLDAGSTGAFAENADAMGISMTGLDAYVLSHGHYDHSGGFEQIFLRDPEARVYARKEVLDVYLSAAGGMHEISVPQNVASHRERFILVDGIREILPGVILVPHHTKGLERIGEKSGLYKMQGGQIVPDDFAHEQSLVIDTPNGLVVFNSCSHAGAANIIREIKDACGQKHVYAYVGGLHMKGKKDNKEICTFSDAEIDALCDVFRQEGVERIYTGHCTGQPGFEELRSRLGNRIYRLSTGLQVEIM